MRLAYVYGIRSRRRRCALRRAGSRRSGSGSQSGTRGLTVTPMQLEALKTYCDVVRFHSFSQGATANNITQPAASQIVQQIEERLGVKLIDRSRRPWELTEDGRVFYEGCQEMVDRYERLLEEMRHRQQKPDYTVRVAAIYSVDFQDLTQLHDRFREAMPGCDSHFDFLHPKEVYRRVQEDEADLGIVSFPQHIRDLSVIHWRDERLVVACPPTNQYRTLAEAGPIQPSALNGLPFVAFERGLVVRQEIQKFLRKHGATPRILIELETVDSVKRAVMDKLGISILPEPTLVKEMEAGRLLAIPFADDIPGGPPKRPMCIIRRRRRPANLAIQKFIDLFLELLRPADAPMASPELLAVT